MRKQNFMSILMLATVLLFSSCGEDKDNNNTNTNIDFSKIKNEFVLVESGTFNMGAQSTNPDGINYESDAAPEAKPVHSVTLDNFYIGKYEVTQNLWKSVMGWDSSNFQWPGQSNFPVEKVNWDDVVGSAGSIAYTINGIDYKTDGFCYKLSEKVGGNTKFRLPTEAEWEYAARGGNKSKGYKYSGSNNVDEVGWRFDIMSATTKQVGTKKPNELGIYDMTGNLYERCSDWYGSYNSAPQTNPTGPSSGTVRVIRGGCWFNESVEYFSVSYHGYNNIIFGDQEKRTVYVGLRLVMVP